MSWSTHSLLFVLLFLFIGSADALSNANLAQALNRRQAAPYTGPTSFQSIQTVETYVLI